MGHTFLSWTGATTIHVTAGSITCKQITFSPFLLPLSTPLPSALPLIYIDCVCAAAVVFDKPVNPGQDETIVVVIISCCLFFSTRGGEIEDILYWFGTGWL